MQVDAQGLGTPTLTGDFAFFLIWQLDTCNQVDQILGPTKMDLDLTQSVFKKFRKFIQVSADVYFH